DDPPLLQQLHNAAAKQLVVIDDHHTRVVVDHDRSAYRALRRSMAERGWADVVIDHPSSGASNGGDQHGPREGDQLCVESSDTSGIGAVRTSCLPASSGWSIAAMTPPGSPGGRMAGPNASAPSATSTRSMRPWQH